MKAPNRPRIWRKLLLSVLGTAAFFGGLELLLGRLGIEPLIRSRDPFVGFVSKVPLFVEVTTPDGPRLETASNKLAFFNRQRFTRAKGTGTQRVFCLGGSTTYGRPYSDSTSFCGWLRELLPHADPGSDWEVVNAGGISYASYRVASVLEELCAFEPDLFVVYTGHNEFLEERTYRGLRNESQAVRGAQAFLTHTRTFTAIKSLVDAAAGRSSEQNFMRQVFPDEVEAILDSSVGPSAYHRDDELRATVLAEFAFNVRRMIDTARAAGARIVFVTPASNLRHSSPFKSEASITDPPAAAAWESAWSRALELQVAGELERALADTERALALDPRYAAAHFLRGTLLHDLGRHAEASAAFIAARDEDVCPLRAITALQATLAQVCAEEQVPLVDFVEVVAAAASPEVPGADLFLDHVHPTIEGHRLAALAVIETLIESEWVEAACRLGSACSARRTRARRSFRDSG